MKRSVLFSLLALIGISLVFSQAYHKGQFSISPGVLIGNYRPYSGDTGFPVMASAEYGLTNLIGLGPFAGIAQYRFEEDGEKYGPNFTNFGIRADLHYLSILENLMDTTLNSDKLDVYIGALVGYESVNFTSTDDRNPPEILNNRIFIDMAAGIRYYLHERVAIYGEVGFILYGVLNLGVTVRWP